MRLQILYSLAKGFDYDKEEIDHINSLIKSLRRFQWVDELARESLPVRVLLEQHVCLPNRVARPLWDPIDPGAYVRLALDWLRFTVSHPRYVPEVVRKFPGVLKTVLSCIRL